MTYPWHEPDDPITDDEIQDILAAADEAGDRAYDYAKENPADDA